MRWLDSITNSVDMNWSKLWEIVGESNGTPLQYSCLENPMDGGVWWAAFMGSQRVPWTERSSHSILKEINPDYSLEGLMLKLKLQYFWPPGAKN